MHRCGYCGGGMLDPKEVKGRQRGGWLSRHKMVRTKDHITPKSYGGRSRGGRNLAYVHAGCNILKAEIERLARRPEDRERMARNFNHFADRRGVKVKPGKRRSRVGNSGEALT